MKRGLLLLFVLLLPFVSAAGVERAGIQDNKLVIQIQGKVNSQIEFFKEGASRGTYKLCTESICNFKTKKEFRISLSTTGINEIGDYVLRIEEVDDKGNAAVQSYPLTVNRENLDACSDSTLEGACSSTRPLFCEKGQLVERCGKGTFSYYTSNLDLGITTIHTRYSCGECPTGKICQADGSCAEETIIEEPDPSKIGFGKDIILSIATTKDEFDYGEKIELTDPPEDISSEGEKITGDVITEINPTNYQDMNNFVNVGEKDFERPKYDGYIVQFKEKPVLKKKVEIEKGVKQNKQTSNSLKKIAVVGSLLSSAYDLVSDVYTIQEDEIEDEIKSYREDVEDKHYNTKQKILSKLNKNRFNDKITGNVVANPTSDIKILGEYKDVFNGVALDISDEEAQKLKELKEVEDIYLNYEVHATLIDSIPLINADKVWQLDADGNNCQETGKECLTGKDVTIVVIDTGVDYSHPDLGGCLGGDCKVIGGNDFVNRDNDPMDDNGHGTHVAGIIAGVVPDTKLYAYKVLDKNGGGAQSGVLAAIERSVDPNQDGDFSDHVDVISLSLGGFGYPDDPQSQAIDTAVRNGVVAVIAAGNRGPSDDTIDSPGTAKNAITVGASDKNDNIANFSSRGPTSIGAIKPDIIAPGVDICSAKSKYLFPSEEYFLPNLCEDNNHLKFSGTSMATPMVSGAVALLKQKNPEWSPEEIKYTLRSTAIDIGEGITAQGYGRIDILKAIQLINPPSIIELDTYGEVRGIINILGEIETNNFYNYRLEYGIGISPKDWKEITNSLEKPLNNILIDNFDTRKLKENEIYRLRLIVTDIYGKISEDNSLIKPNNVNINFPGGNNPTKYSSAEEYIKNSYIRDKIIKIKGTVTGEDLQNYVLIYASEDNLNNWESNGITLEDNGQKQIINDVLATLDTSFLNNGKYKLKLIVNYGSEQVEETVDIIIQKDQRENWPIMLGTRVTVADIDFNYPGKEVVVGVWPGWVEVRHFDGSLVEGWPQKTTKPTQAYPSVGDIDGDNIPEIIIGAGSVGGEDVAYAFKSKVYAWHSDGTSVNGWPKVVDGFVPTVALADIDNDNINEIIASSGNKLYVWNSDGTSVNGWPKELDTEITTTAAIGDIDKDGNKELVVATRDNNIHIFKNNDTYFNNWPKKIVKKIGTNIFESSPVLADIDADGYLEIITAVNSYSENNPDDPIGEIYVFNYDGSSVEGWPRETGTHIVSSPAIGDLDFNYKGLEIVVSSWDSTGKVYAWHSDGTNVNGWPKSIENCRYNIESSPIIGDVTSDGKPEVIIGCSFDNKLYAYNSNANLIMGWPKITLGRIIELTPSLDDLDDDGDIEILIGDSSFGFTYIWDLEETFSPSYIEWGMFHNNIQHTGCYGCEKDLRPQSKIWNRGGSEIKGILTFYIKNSASVRRQIYKSSELTIKSGDKLGLDTIFNPIGISLERGNYKVIVVFDEDGKSYEASYEFRVV